MATVDARVAAPAEEVFEQEVSDHLPQEYRVRHPSLCVEVDVLSWNVMARCMCRRPGASLPGREPPAGAGAEGGARTNNGFDLDEEIGAYEKRLAEFVAPRVAAWIAARLQQPASWVVCLQEMPGHPGLFADFVRSVAAGSGLAQGASLRHAELAVSASARIATLWSAGDWDLKLHATSGDGFALCTVLVGTKEVAASAPALRVLNCHLPIAGATVGAAQSGTQGARRPQEVAGELLAAAPAGQVALVVGDLNFDVQKARGELCERSGGVDASGAVGSLVIGSVPDSTYYHGQLISRDAALLSDGRAEAESLSPVARGDGSEAGPLGGLSRQDFIAQNVHYNLQARVRQLDGLSDEDLGRLGAYHFGDQPAKLEEWLASGRIAGSARPASGDVAHEQSPDDDPFKGRSRGDFVRKHIHHKLQSKVAKLGDRDLWLLGQLHFGEQHAEFERMVGKAPSGSGGAKARPAAPESNQAATLRLMGRGAPAPTSSPSSGSGRASASQQGHGSAPARRGFFEGLLGCSREEYVKEHIDYKLQESVRKLGDVEVFELGQEKFADQAEHLKWLGTKKQHAGHSGAASKERGASWKPWNAVAAQQDVSADAGTSQDWGDAAPTVDEWAVAAPLADDWGVAAPGASAVDWSSGSRPDTSEGHSTEEAQRPGGATLADPRVRVPGLAAWLAGLSLGEYNEAAQAWCEEMGAICLEEVVENVEELADHLGLRPLERRRMLRAVESAGGAGT